MNDVESFRCPLSKVAGDTCPNFRYVIENRLSELYYIHSTRNPPRLQEIMRDPVLVSESGRSCERANIEACQWLAETMYASLS